MNDTASAERLHIGFFGRSNVGKSSLVNAVTGQEVAVVAPAKGTTTDPVPKSMELLPLGPVVILDTPGLDDDTALGDLRVRRARQVLNRVDMAVMVLDAAAGVLPADAAILELIRARAVPCVVAINKCDLPHSPLALPAGLPSVEVSAATGTGIDAFKAALAAAMPPADGGRRLVGDLLAPGEVVLLVTPIDAAAPKGRLILPQVQTLRDILDSDAVALVVKETQLPTALAGLAAPPRLVITDSQVFAKVAAMLPATIPLTSFSILFSRYKGYLADAVKGAAALDRLQDGDRLLIAEGCTHRRQCGDIGTQKLPALIRRHCPGRQLEFEFSSGASFPEGLSRYAAVIHCGGCMLTEREVRYRARCARDQGVPFTNYGIAIAHLNGILPRCLAPLGR